MNWRKTRKQGQILLDIPAKLGTLKSRARESIRHGPEVTLADAMQSLLWGWRAHGVKSRSCAPRVRTVPLSEWSRGMHVWVYVGGLTTMTSTSGDGKLAQLYGLLKIGQLSRREFMDRAVVLGVALPVLTFVVNSLDMKGASAAPGSIGKLVTGR